MIDAFQACIIKVGCGIGGWDMLTWTSFPNSTKMNVLFVELVRGLFKINFQKDKVCEACQMGKQIKNSFKNKNFISTTRPLELLHMDLFGPSRKPNLGGKSYAYVIVDDFSRYTWILFLSQKNEAFYEFSKFCNKVQNKKRFYNYLYKK